jgi:putative ABC transport system permease protein
VKPVDPLTYIGMSVGVVVVAFIASYVPARKASSVDPMETLRAE